jgi:hypothetical protein
VDATNIYWAPGGNVMSMPVAGGTPTTVASSVDATQIAVDATNIYATTAVGTVVKIAKP